MIGIACLKLDPGLSEETVREFVLWYRKMHVPGFLQSAAGAVVKARRLDPKFEPIGKVMTLYEFADGVDAAALMQGPVAKASWREYRDVWGARLGKTELNFEVYDVFEPLQAPADGRDGVPSS